MKKTKTVHTAQVEIIHEGSGASLTYEFESDEYKSEADILADFQYYLSIIVTDREEVEVEA